MPRRVVIDCLLRIRILVSLKTANLMIRELSKKRTRPKAKVA